MLSGSWEHWALVQPMHTAGHPQQWLQNVPLHIWRAGREGSPISEQCRESALSLHSATVCSIAKAMRQLSYSVSLLFSSKILLTIFQLVVCLQAHLWAMANTGASQETVTQSYFSKPVHRLLVLPENHLLLPAVNYLCCYTPSRKLFSPKNAGVGPHIFSLLPNYAMSILRQTGLLSTMYLILNCSLPENLYTPTSSRIMLFRIYCNKLVKCFGL